MPDRTTTRTWTVELRLSDALSEITANSSVRHARSPASAAGLTTTCPGSGRHLRRWILLARVPEARAVPWRHWRLRGPKLRRNQERDRAARRELRRPWHSRRSRLGGRIPAADRVGRQTIDLQTSCLTCEYESVRRRPSGVGGSWHHSLVQALPYPHPTSTAATNRMRGNRRADTRPEMRLRSALHRRGMRFRKDYRIDAGHRRVRADVAFPRQRLAVFVDGCFWHSCPDHGAAPKSNLDYWIPKLQGNIDRDRAVDQALQDSGWTVLRFWAHVPVAVAAREICQRIAGSPLRRTVSPSEQRRR